MNRVVLVTGATGKTGRRLAERLARRGVRARAASRGGAGVAGCEGVRFSWAEPESYGGALGGVGAVYLVAPTDAGEPLEAMLPFLERARGAGVWRFVLLSSSALDEGGPLLGRVHAWLKTEAPEWTVLRPSWFMQNFSEAQHLRTIRDEGKIYTAAGDGRVPFIDADDIAAAAEAALLAPESYNHDFVLTGPETLSYDDAARLIAKAAGRPLEHVRLSEAQLAGHLTRSGVGAAYAAALAALNTAISNGAEDRLSDGVSALTGRAPERFENFALENASRWAHPA